MEECNPFNTPSNSQAKLPDGNRNRRKSKEKPFIQLIGPLIYLAIATSPDMVKAYSVKHFQIQLQAKPKQAV